MSSVELKSQNTNVRAFVRFVNKTNRQIDIIWVNFSGVFLKYATLKHDQFIDVNTFVQHPWLFLDSKTRDRMCVDNKDVFFAKSYPHFLNFRCLSIERSASVRQCVAIRLPIYSLKMSAVLTVRNCLTRVKDVNSLEIPEVLKNDIQEAFDTQDTPILPVVRN